mmetsp:Transcript_4238/g.11846  ORF Transcript_4238/g.11846 Transcript_4238/m.11846 type:complete len:264 (-) Transcript_4238:165-956(-)|eukprot:CAMPEP_0119140796 /NCGR_PEP_ID=MMETSP1310-20130426/29863_1 /TAXON_ID=464262 /ORGANISM="Genus nov. species nov., Strain RCC2339" /LENGTH=263 /DNA_ID=CAMNT_0007132185 /DNA_START=145 /DNA_END=936 /DNA_ORIENTATION=-
MSVLAIPFGFAVYVYSLWVFVCMVVWVGNYNHLVPQEVAAIVPLFPSMDDSATAPLEEAAIVPALVHDAIPLLAFAITHIIMARRWFKQAMERNIYGDRFERSIFVLVASVCFHWMMATWKPVNNLVVGVPAPLSNLLLLGPFLGCLVVLLSSFNLDHFHLFGLKQSLGLRADLSFSATYFYAVVRHPLMLGFFIAFWSTPMMTYGHLLFAVTTSVFIIFTVYVFEEPDLVKALPVEYPHYQKNVWAFCPLSVGYKPINKKKL